MMKMIPISDFCKVVSGATPRRDTKQYWGGDIPWVTPKELSNLSNPVLYETEECITEEGLASCSAQMLPENAILFSSRAPIGHIAIVGQPMCTNQGFKSLIPNEHTDSRYLYHCLQHMKPALVNQGRGATFKEINKEIMEKFNIPIPYANDPKTSLAEQRRIAGILDKADAIRKQRRESLALADEFLKSTFLDMFGDPANNPKQWDVKPIGKYCTTAKKVNPTRQPDIAFSYIDIGSVNCSTGTIEAAREILGIDAPSRARQKVLAGDVLAATVRPNLRGTAFVPNSLDGQICSTGFSVLRPDGKNINTEYLYSITRNMWFTNTLVSMCTGANYPAVRHSDVMRINIPYPPIDIQNRFAEIVKKQRAMLSRSHVAAEEADNLFNSLVQRAFKGELS